MSAKPPSVPSEKNDPVSIPPPSGVFAEPFSLGKLGRLMGLFGPAAIVASLAIGAGETIVVVRAGSWAGYELLWLVLLGALVKGLFLTYMLGRYTAISGQLIGDRLVRLPGPRGWILIAIIVMDLATAPLGWTAIAKPCGYLFEFLLRDMLPNIATTSAWQNLFTTGFIGLACSVALMLSFERLEKQQIIICGILVGGTILGTLMVRPDLWQALCGSLNIGRLPSEFPAWTPEDTQANAWLTMATIFGYTGGGVLSYVVYANWISMHGWGLCGHEQIETIRRRAAAEDSIDYLPEDPEQVRRLRRLCTALRWDVGMGAMVLFIVTAAFMMAGAAVLYPMLDRGEIEGGFENWDLLTDLSHVWSSIHPSLVWIYYICIMAALWGTLQALPEVYARVSHEFFRAIWPNRAWDFRRMKRIICIYLFTFSTLLVWSGLPFNLLIHITGFIACNLALALVMFAALYLNFKLPKAYRTRWPMLLGAMASAVVLSIMATISAWGLAMKWLAAG